MGVRKMKEAKYESGMSTLAYSGHRDPVLKVMAKVCLCALAAVSSLGVLVAVLGE